MLSRVYHWTPEQIYRITLQELNHYMEQLTEYYGDNLKPAEVSLVEIRHALYSFLGIDEKAQEAKQEPKVIPFPRFTVTKPAMQAWEKAGRPEPRRFFKEYDNARSDSS